jgi:hypothetical protein
MGLRRLSKEEFNPSRPINTTSNLIKEVDANYKPGASEKKYYFDKNTQEVYESKPLSLSKKDWTYYIIDFDEIVEIKGLAKRLTERDDSCFLNITINYSAQIQRNPQKGLIKLLIGENHPEKALNNRIIRWISAFSSNEPEFVKRFFSLKTLLEHHLEDEAKKLGLSLDLAIDVKEDNHSNIISGQVDVKACDYHNKIPLSFELELNVIEAKKVEGMQSLTNSVQLKEKIEGIIKKAIYNKKTIDLNFLHFKLNTGLRDLLIREIDVALDRDGLKPEFLTLNCQLKNLPPNREQLTHNVNCITKNSYDIVIEHHLILTLNNLGNFYSSGITNLNQWVKSELERITQDYIFEKDFTDLALSFNSDYIKDEMVKSVVNKGYEIKQLIIVPKLKGIVPDYFDFEVGKDIEFPTQKDDVKVKLNIVINGKIEEPKKLTKYINPSVTRDSIILKMKETVVNTVRQFIHRVDPQMFYMHFDSPCNGEDISLSDELKERLKSKLEVEFGSNHIEIILKQLETDLIKKFKALQGISHPVYIENFTKQARFQCYFYVERVSNSGYHLFIAKCDAHQGKDIKEIFEEIARVIKNRTEIELNTKFNYKDSSVITPQFTNYILELLRKSKVLIEEEFGLIIRYSGGLKRLASKGELLAQKECEKEIELFDKITKVKINQSITEANILSGHDINKLKKILAIDLGYTDELIEPDTTKDLIKEKEAKMYQPKTDLKEVNADEVEIPNSIDFNTDMENKSLDSDNNNEEEAKTKK